MDPDLEPEKSVDGQGVNEEPPRGRRRPDLATATDVRREMAKVYREMRTGKVASQDGTRLTYVLSAIGKLIESSDLEQRIKAIEQAIAGRKH